MAMRHSINEGGMKYFTTLKNKYIQESMKCITLVALKKISC